MTQDEQDYLRTSYAVRLPGHLSILTIDLLKPCIGTFIMESIIGEATSICDEGVIRNNNIRAVDDMDLNSNTGPNSKAKASPTLTLRTLPESSRYFWKTSHSELLSQTVYDKRPDGVKRVLPENEVAVMALNEIAAIRGLGFFFHLKSRTCWRGEPQDCPRSRALPRLG